MVLEETTFNKLRINSPPGGWFPALQDLFISITESNLLYADLFFSPCLKTIRIYVTWPWHNAALPLGFSQTFTSIISALPTSNLEQILVAAGHHAIHGRISKTRSLLPFCVADHHLQTTVPQFHCRMPHWTT